MKIGLTISNLKSINTDQLYSNGITQHILMLNKFLTQFRDTYLISNELLDNDTSNGINATTFSKFLNSTLS